MSVPPEVTALRDRLKAWLFDDALPLWWDAGTDHARGGFREALALDGTPTEGPRRVRVAARQVYVFAQAGRMGWTGPWRAAVEHGVTALLEVYRRPGGLFRFSADATGAAVDDSIQPYEQAFALLALSAAHQALPDAGFEARALRTRDALAALLGRPDGGVHDDAGRGAPLRANPLMHLFEAALAWREAGTDAGWAELADRIARLALTRLIQPASGALPELFDGDWRPTPGAEVEPGHQFEWGFLLLRQARLTGDPATAERAAALIALAEKAGVDEARGVAIMTLGQDLLPRDTTARLWPQTERTRAGALLAETLPEAGWPIAQAGAESLLRYLDVPRRGLWHERMEPDGTFRDEPSPASSLYHLVGAIQALDEACLIASS
jgi:mannose/cellobiose epimerase-like protein (N-acyl-D-glucosamine 2-epimerase family)